MSDIPYARELLQEVLDHDDRLDPGSRRRIEQALANMYREAPVRFAPSKPVRITQDVRREVRRLARTSMTMTEIARVVGLRNQGRISEVLNGKR